MRLSEKRVRNREEEGVVLEYVELTKEFREIREYLLGRNKRINCYQGKQSIVQISLEDILYFEAVKELVFAYTKEEVYEVKQRLYQLEKELREEQFLRASKSVLIHMPKITSVRPALNGRFYAKMENDEDIIISRQYAGEIKQYIMEGL